jgi:hypothetical protein
MGVKQQNTCFKLFSFIWFSFQLNPKRFNKRGKRFHNVILIRSRIIYSKKLKCFLFLIECGTIPDIPLIEICKIINYISIFFSNKINHIKI